MCESAFIDPGGPASSGLAGLYLSQRALEQAEGWAKKGLEAKPDNRRAKELLGDALNQMGRLDEARAVWLETLKLGEEDEAKLKVVAKTLASSAQTAVKGGDTSLAERLLRRAATFDPENAATAAALAHILLRNEQPGLAERWGNFAQSMNPEEPEALFVLGELAFLEGNKDEAKQLFEKIPKRSKMSGMARQRLAKM
jgi:Flp pilus assembly protein TadD